MAMPQAKTNSLSNGESLTEKIYHLLFYHQVVRLWNLPVMMDGSAYKIALWILIILEGSLAFRRSSG